MSRTQRQRRASSSCSASTRCTARASSPTSCSARAPRSPRPRCRVTSSEVGAVKVRRGRSLVYAVPGEGSDVAPVGSLGDTASARLRRTCEELLVSASPAVNLVVLRTPAGAANYLALASTRRGTPRSSAPSPATTRSCS